MTPANNRRSRWLIPLAIIGPGMLTAMAGNDAGGISTFSVAGAEFGYATLWLIPIMTLQLAIVQETVSRMGAVTGKGFAALIREKFGLRASLLAMALLLFSNAATSVSEFAGIAAATEVLGSLGQVLEHTVQLNRRVVDAMEDPVLAGQLAISKLKEVADKHKRHREVAEALAELARDADEPVLRRCAAFAAVELCEKAGEPEMAGKILLAIIRESAESEPPLPSGAAAM